MLEEEILYAENFNLDTVFSPVKYDVLESLLTETGYDRAKTEYLVQGFKEGFDLGYRGKMTNIRCEAPNLKITIGSKIELWNKVMKEVKAKRYAGPYDAPPFDDFIQSPIGLVPKDNGKATRLIFHLSYPRPKSKDDKNNFSVNGNTPETLTTVKYPDVSDAIRLCLKCGKKCKMGKSDMKSAFRHFGINPKFWKFLIMKAENPNTGKMCYFVDKCMPFGAAISCSHFQKFSDAISHIVQHKTSRQNINYLDDFFFAAFFLSICNQQIATFLDVCDSIAFPISLEKTEWGSMYITFLGFLLDSANQKVYIPKNKVDIALEMIEQLLYKRKGTVKQIQRICGLLNFFGRCIIPGRAFTRRLYALTSNLKGHYHVRINQEAVADLMTWRSFLNNQAIYCRNFADFSITKEATEIDMYSDSSCNPNLGCGGISNSSWFAISWDPEFIKKNKPSIAYLELYAVTVAVMCWVHRYKDMKIALFCDNISAVHMINNTSSKCRNCMVLIRMIVLQGLIHNVKITAKHVPGSANFLSDCLSRKKFKAFWDKSNRKYENEMTKIPECLWPMSKIWIPTNN